MPTLTGWEHFQFYVRFWLVDVYAGVEAVKTFNSMLDFVVEFYVLDAPDLVAFQFYVRFWGYLPDSCAEIARVDLSILC